MGLCIVERVWAACRAVRLSDKGRRSWAIHGALRNLALAMCVSADHEIWISGAGTC